LKLPSRNVDHLYETDAIPKSAHTGTLSKSYQLLMECYPKVPKSSYQHASGATSWSSFTLPNLAWKKTKQRACMLIYWPGINSDIKKFINKCGNCAKVAQNNQNEPLINSTIPVLQWQQVGFDLFEWNKQQ